MMGTMVLLSSVSQKKSNKCTKLEKTVKINEHTHNIEIYCSSKKRELIFQFNLIFLTRINVKLYSYDYKHTICRRNGAQVRTESIGEIQESPRATPFSGTSTSPFFIA
jgi:hypothetical protein